MRAAPGRAFAPRVIARISQRAEITVALLASLPLPAAGHTLAGGRPSVSPQTAPASRINVNPALSVRANDFF